MSTTGKYIYGITPSSGPEHASPGGIPDFPDVHAIHHQDVTAVVGDAEIVDYRRLRKDALGRLLVRHQQVIERIMGFGRTIIPVRLGTFACDDAEVRSILIKGYRLIKEIIPNVQDKWEIDVAVTWADFPSLLREIGELTEIAELKRALLSDPNGVTADAAMNVGLAVKKKLDAKKQHYASVTQDALRKLGLDRREHELMDDRMVMNSAFLMSRGKQADFHGCIESLNAEFADKLNFRCVGPLPPYSFYTIEIKKLAFTDLLWARDKLGLRNGAATGSDIKEAYHRAAVRVHPDKNPNRSGMEKEFSGAARAHKILAECCLANAQAGPEGQEARVFFTETDFTERGLLVKVAE